MEERREGKCFRGKQRGSAGGGGRGKKDGEKRQGKILEGCKISPHHFTS